MLRPTTLHKAALAMLVVIFTVLHSPAQEGTIQFGQATPEELNMKECSFDKNADAVILLDHATASFNEEHHLITERRIRIKILKEKGVRQGDVRLPFYSKDGFEYLNNIEAVVINPGENGSFTISQLERKNIFTRQANQVVSLVSFALPNVKVGSILDYKYQSTMKSYAGLDRWEFQSELPTVTSFYELAPLANSEFAYSVYKSPDMPIQVTPNKQLGKIRFVMNNIPGLRNEVYMTTTRSFLQRVNFQFAAYTNYMGKTNYTTTWKQMADELVSHREFGSQANKDLSGTPLVKNLDPGLSELEKLKTIFQYVRTNITWDGYTSRFTVDGVKSVMEKKKGTTADINLLLVSLLRSAGLTAYPVMVSERDHGLVDTAYPYLDQFNKVVAMAMADGKQYVLDGTDLATPFFMVPADLLNTTGFIVDKKKYGFIYFNNLPHKQRELIAISGTIREDGVLEGKANVSQSEYARLAKKGRFGTEKARYLEDLIKPHGFIKVDSFEVEGLKDDSAALKEMVGFHFDLQKNAGYHLLTYNLFTGLTENPFITQYRFTDIDFGTKYSLVLVGDFTLPASMAVETLPASKKMVSPDRSMSVTRLMEKSENRVSMKATIEINREKYAAHEYEGVKAFFKEMVDLLNEPVLLKAK